MTMQTGHKTLLLNADHRPLMVAPPSMIGWQDAIKGVLSQAYYALAEHDRVVSSQKLSMRVPSVVAMRTYVPVERLRAPLTRWNLFLAYGFRCVFCREQFASEHLTFEHLLPQSRGGTSTWDNLLPACSPCNSAKGCRTPQEAKMPMAFTPFRPTIGHMNRMAVQCAETHPFPDAGWKDVLYWTVDLVP